MGCLKITYKNYLTFSKSKKSVCSDYRYGFNGQEKVDEIAGVGNHNTALFWEYDTRLGRRWNLDPVVKHSLSGYSTFANNPIWCIDVNGDDSTLTSGGTTWSWTSEAGNTYESISKRTGVSVDDLNKWNNNCGGDLQMNDVVNISDPSASAPDKAAGISVDGRVINVQQYIGWSTINNWTSSGTQGIMMVFNQDQIVTLQIIDGIKHL
jgi:hypothetical protein